MTTSINRQEALHQFKLALKAGQKCYRDCVHRGRDPYPQVLEELLQGGVAYDSTIKVLGFLPDVESISAFGETQADAIRLIEGWLNADTAQSVRKYGKELWIMTWTPEVGLTTPENLKKIHPFHPDALLINDVTTLRP